MTQVIEQHQREIESLCRRHGVSRLQSFGSAARGEFDPRRSDLDFFVEFRERDYRGSSDRYFGLLHGLEDLFGRHIDLVERAAVQSSIFLAVSQQLVEEVFNDAGAAQAP